ncbi:hypothetical protein PFAG_05410 [Plasmodium falciparum Santa Lucia]|uniref:Uncharacterized protein n=2 Tax=Plasmodium falciparum TaxID=5833 RepID=W7FAG0_PLAFA|nr:hypothetical protein PFAG_05410 [Plasmodium falciparum Santa Lucia]
MDYVHPVDVSKVIHGNESFFTFIDFLRTKKVCNRRNVHIENSFKKLNNITFDNGYNKENKILLSLKEIYKLMVDIQNKNKIYRDIKGNYNSNNNNNNKKKNIHEMKKNYYNNLSSWNNYLLYVLKNDIMENSYNVSYIILIFILINYQKKIFYIINIYYKDINCQYKKKKKKESYQKDYSHNNNYSLHLINNIVLLKNKFSNNEISLTSKNFNYNLKIKKKYIYKKKKKKKKKKEFLKDFGCIFKNYSYINVI